MTTRSHTPPTEYSAVSPEMIPPPGDTDHADLGDILPDSSAPKTQLDRIEDYLKGLKIMIDGIDGRVTTIERRLSDGDLEFRNLKWDIGLCSNAVKHLCILGGANEQAMVLTSRIAERFDGRGTLTGAEAYRDEPTSPGSDGKHG